MSKLRKGEIYWADLPAETGSVQCGRRPICVLGNPAACEYSPVVTVLPITSRTEKSEKIPTHVLLKTALKRESVILPEQIRSISKDLILGKCIYSLSSEEMKEVDRAVAYQLGLKLS